MNGPTYSPFFARNCVTCLPPREGCIAPRINGPRSRGCPAWNDNPFRTSSSGLYVERMKKAWLAAGFSEDYFPPPPTPEEINDQDEEEI